MTPTARLRDEGVHEAPAEAHTPRERCDRDGLDVALAAAGRREEPCVAEQSTLGIIGVVVDRDEVVAVRSFELATHRLLRPGVGHERGALELHDRVEVAHLGTAHQHAHRSTFLPADGVTSGVRR